jgi:HEAT repeat protein
MLDHPDTNVRALACNALGQIGPEAEAAAPALARQLESGDESLRRHAVAALEKIASADEAVLDALAAAWKAGGKYSAGKARNALWRLRGGATSDVTGPVGDLGHADRDRRLAAAGILEELGSRAMSAVPALEGLLDDPDPVVRAASARALWKITGRPEKLIDPLVGILGDDNTWPFRNAQTLADIGAPAVPALVEELGSPNGRRRTRAAHTLFLMGPAGRGATAGLVAMLDAEDAYERQCACLALEQLGDVPPSAAPALRRCIEELRPDHSWGAAVALCRITGRPDEVLPFLIRGVSSQHDNHDVHYSCLALEAIGPPAAAALPHLERVYWRWANWGRGLTEQAIILARFRVSGGDPELVPMLCRILQPDRDSWPCYGARAAAALGALGPRAAAAVPTLERAASNCGFPYELRQAAAEALKKIRAARPAALPRSDRGPRGSGNRPR